MEKKTENNKGVFQGSPLSAFLFIIYAENMMEHYEKSLNDETKENMESINVRNEVEEKKWTNFLHLKNYRQKGDKQINRPGNMDCNNIIEEKAIDIYSRMIHCLKQIIYQKFMKN